MKNSSSFRLPNQSPVVSSPSVLKLNPLKKLSTFGLANKTPSPTKNEEKKAGTPGLKKGLTIGCINNCSLISKTGSPLKKNDYESPGLETIHDDHCEERSNESHSSSSKSSKSSNSVSSATSQSLQSSVDKTKSQPSQNTQKFMEAQKKLKEKQQRELEKKKQRFAIVLRNKKEIKKQSSRVLNEKVQRKKKMERMGSHSMKDLVSPKLVTRQSDLNLHEAFKIHGEKNKESTISVNPTC